jgi:Putative transposase
MRHGEDGMDRRLGRTCFLRSGYCERGCFHPHLHCVVPGGGISPDDTQWIPCRPRFFFPVRVLSRLFRRLFLKYLEEAFDSGKLRFFSSLSALQDPQAFSRHLDAVRNVNWVVYAKPPFAGPQQVVDYVGRYTHRVAISNHRIVDIEGGQVKFNWRDYRDNNQQKTMTLSAEEFIRRFLLHVLPSGFHRIRNYGFLGNRHRKEKLELCRQLLGMAPPRESSSDTATPEDYRDRYERLTGRSLRECPVCHRGHMIPVTIVAEAHPSPAIQDTS